MTNTNNVQIVINVGDKIELFSGSNDWSLDVTVTSVTAEFVYIQDRDVCGRIDRSLVEADDFGALSAPRWRAQALPVVGQIVQSDRGGDTHGCREGWVATVTAVDGETVTATIAANAHCTSCWQTGCVDDGRDDNDRVGEVISFNVADCRIDHIGQCVVS